MILNKLLFVLKLIHFSYLKIILIILTIEASKLFIAKNMIKKQTIQLLIIK